ncbi:DUF1405 domain-containing protein [Pseudalkalibacillus caeni]|uniref:DUF1405 domain-containing protein n=1 Tax=Exobacillus caeni TaxID=2574798 RepID=A0A5R9F5Y3_9BACL|nr:DUF1405 domain-containing protein [Pseudalkalibacillus caeni]TLS35894.1 DUF1405 domain-containing protein [Pseudalkalibacillus caeni]
MEKYIFYLKTKPFLIMLLVINVLGTIYGYYWYQWQLVETPLKFLIFVPDSPTASLFFVIVLVAFIMKKNVPLIEALAAVTLFKYGVWAVVMNVWGIQVSGQVYWENYLLIFSHAGMALQGLLYAPYYKIKAWHLVVVAIWTLHNDVIDYVFGQMPRYPVLADYFQQIGYFTFWLSIFSLALIYVLAVRKGHYTLSIKI